MKNWIYKNYVVHHAESLDSTNLKAFEMAQNQQIFDREIVLADSQNAGRGRAQRVWISPKGNLYFSLVLCPKVLTSKVSQLSFVAIVALRLAIEDVFYCNKNLENKALVQNKWPNDLLVDGKKIAGILLESQNQGQDCKFVVLGIGVNIASNPLNTIFPATNLAEFGVKISAAELLKKFLDKFENIYQNWLDFGFANVRQSWLNAGYKYKEKISLKDGDDKILGIFQDLNDDGSLILKLESGELKNFTAVDLE